LNLSEQQYLLWDTSSRSTKRKDMQEIRGYSPFGPPGYA